MIRHRERRPGTDTQENCPRPPPFPPLGPQGSRESSPRPAPDPAPSRSGTLLVGIARSLLKRVWISVLVGSDAIFSPSQTPARLTGPVAGQSAAEKAGHAVGLR